MSVKKLLVLILILPLPANLYAQKVVTVSGEYIYYPPDTESYEVSKQKALRRAQTQILADNVGTVINAGAATVVTAAGEGSSEVSTFSLGESLVKGEWLETIGEPEFMRFLDGSGMLAIKVTVRGRAREISSSSIDFDARILRNGVEDKFESLDFNEGDDLYLAFEAPLDGYLAVYLYDGGTHAYCLLPYINMSSGAVAVKGGEKYVFFSSGMANSRLTPMTWMNLFSHVRVRLKLTAYIAYILRIFLRHRLTLVLRVPLSRVKSLIRVFRGGSARLVCAMSE